MENVSKVTCAQPSLKVVTMAIGSQNEATRITDGKISDLAENWKIPFEK